MTPKRSSTSLSGSPVTTWLRWARSPSTWVARCRPHSTGGRDRPPNGESTSTPVVTGGEVGVVGVRPVPAVDVVAVTDAVGEATGAARRDGIRQVDATVAVEERRLTGLGQVAVLDAPGQSAERQRHEEGTDETGGAMAEAGAEPLGDRRRQHHRHDDGEVGEASPDGAPADAYRTCRIRPNITAAIAIDVPSWAMTAPRTVPTEKTRRSSKGGRGAALVADEGDEGEDGSHGGRDGQRRQPAVLHTTGEQRAAETDRRDADADQFRAGLDLLLTGLRLQAKG